MLVKMPSRRLETTIETPPNRPPPTQPLGSWYQMAAPEAHEPDAHLPHFARAHSKRPSAQPIRTQELELAIARTRGLARATDFLGSPPLPMGVGGSFELMRAEKEGAHRVSQDSWRKQEGYAHHQP